MHLIKKSMKTATAPTAKAKEDKISNKVFKNLQHHLHTQEATLLLLVIGSDLLVGNYQRQHLRPFSARWFNQTSLMI